MRILFLNPVGVLGGAERAMLDLMVCLRKQEARLSLHLRAGTDGPLLDEARAAGVDARVLPLPEQLSALGDSALRGHGAREAWRFARSLVPTPALLARYGHALRQEVVGLRPDLLHSNGIKTHLLSPFTAGLPLSRVWHIHDFLGERPLARLALSSQSRLATAVIANSQAVGEDARRVLGRTPIHVVHNGVDVERFSTVPHEVADLDALAHLPPAPEGTSRVGLVATYARWKGHDVFLEAASEMVRREPGLPVRFYLVGAPLYRTPGSQFTEDELRQRIAHHGLLGRVGLVPFQEDPSRVYRALTLFVHASTRPEPFGLTIAEALACGRPAIVSRASGAAEALTDDVDAQLITPGDARTLATSMQELLSDATRRARLGEAARRTAVEHFSRERYAREVLEVYRAVLSTRRSAHVPVA